MALAPVLAQPTAAPVAGWAAVCTAQGLERVAIGDTTDDPAAPSRSSHPAHCPLCSASAALLPPAPTSLRQPERASLSQPPFLARATGRGRWWPGTAARAPPAVAQA